MPAACAVTAQCLLRAYDFTDNLSVGLTVDLTDGAVVASDGGHDLLLLDAG